MNRSVDGIDLPCSTHRRRNALTGEWTLVAAGRDKRPWRGQTEIVEHEQPPAHDPTCFLCPGNERVGGVRHPDYTSTFVFTNDFAALQPSDGEPPEATDGALFASERVAGTCKVICYSPNHAHRLATMSHADVVGVVDVWCSQHAELAERWKWVQIFENCGSEMGASSPHPHGQIWAGSSLPSQISTEGVQQRRYFEENRRPLLADYIERERMLGDRIVADNGAWIVVVPYWATWPFETLLLSADGARGFGDLTTGQRASLAVMLGEILRAYDALFGRPFPYSMGWHPAPVGEASEHWTLHGHFFPPLLRADARKFLVGYELLSEVQRDLTPEDAAARLRDAAVCSVGKLGGVTHGAS